MFEKIPEIRTRQPLRSNRHAGQTTAVVLTIDDRIKCPKYLTTVSGCKMLSFYKHGILLLSVCLILQVSYLIICSSHVSLLSRIISSILHRWEFVDLIYQYLPNSIDLIYQYLRNSIDLIYQYRSNCIDLIYQYLPKSIVCSLIQKSII